MAKLMVKTDLSGVEGVDGQAAELLVTVAKIDTRALKARKVRVPRGYSLTMEDVQQWTNSAKAIVARTSTQ